MSNTIDEADLVPELGDMLTIISDIHKSTTGRIIYRDGAMIRIRPAHVSDRAVDFPLDPASGLFQDSLGVQELILHEKAKYPHYARQLGVLPGESLEFYSKEGAPSADPGVIATLLVSDEQDAIQLEDGRILNFAFVGPQEPYTVIVPRSAPEEFSTTNNNTEAEVEAEAELPEIDLPAPLVEEIPTSERTYSDAVQREDMFVGLLLDIPTARQKNPRILRQLYRTTDLLLALKNSMVVRDSQGSVLADQAQTYVPNTVTDLLSLQVSGAPVPALLPVADVKKVVYVDAVPDGMYEDVDVRQDTVALTEAAMATQIFREEGSNPFLAYMDVLLSRNLPAVVPNSQQPTHYVQMDQDVLRTRAPPAPVQGFPAGLPAAVTKGDAVDLTPEYLGTVGDRTIRLLAATTLQNRRTGTAFQIAPADSGETVDHILLSDSVLDTRAPTRSSVLLWDLQASETSRRKAGAFYKTLLAAWDAQTPVSQYDATTGSLATVFADRIPTALQIAERGTLGTLDAFGMRTLELNEGVLEVLVKALAAGREAWDTAMTALRQRAIAALGDSIPVPTEVPEGHALWTEAVGTQADMASALGTLKDREPALATTQAARTSYILSLANGTLLDVWYGAAGAIAAEAMAVAVDTYHAERRRLERGLANARAAEAAIAAVPAVNECTHVYLLESIRGIREDAKRFVVLQDFLTKYQGGVRGNWVICGSCDKNLICRHELMLLHEFLHPGRSVALHKTLLLEFSGPVFEGAYICKNCGQKIAELEFDTHLEFDDEGRPLVGRTVVQPAKKVAMEAEKEKEGEAEEAEEADAENLLINVAAPKDVPFEGEDLKLYYVTRTVLEFCGITPTAELYDRIVPSARDFLKERVNSEDFYKALVARSIAEKRPYIPYKNYVANSVLTVIGALIVLEIQTGDLPIPFPLQGCKLDRGGFPLEKEGDGCMTYVICVIAGIKRFDDPWVSAMWSKETSLPKRQALVAMPFKQNMNLLLALPGPGGKAPAPLTTVTATYKARLDAKREGAALVEDANLYISSDRIPPAFRPLPVVKPEGGEAVPNASKLQQDVREGSIAEVKAYVARRQHAVIQESLQAFHKVSANSAKALHILSETNPRSDAACCYQRLGVVALQGAGVQSITETLGAATTAEVTLLEDSARQVRQRDPAASANGTHIYVPWSAPQTQPQMPAADPSMYYKLFVKNCFRGENMGFPHEYGLDWVCRHCKYACPPELEYLTGAELGNLDGKKFQKAMEELEAKRQQLAIASLEGQVDETSFRALEDAIHARKSVSAFVYPGAVSLFEILESMRRQLVAADLPDKDWGILQSLATRLIAMPPSPQRRAAITPFGTAHDAALKGLETRMMDLLGARPSEKMRDSVLGTLESLTQITAVVQGAQGARNLVTFLLVPMEQVAAGYKNEKPRVNKWFPKVAPSHRELLHKIWAAQNTVATAGMAGLKELKDAAKGLVQSVLRRLTTWMGPWLQWWIRDFRGEFTEMELALMLRWSVAQAMLATVTDESPLLRGYPIDVRKAAMQFFNGFFMDALRVARVSIEKTQLTPKEIQEALLARQEMERAEFIRRFDVLDRDMRKIELMKKNLKIGDWAVGTMKNLFQYDAEFYEFERGQRAAMGLPEFDEGVTGPGGAAENPYGFMTTEAERVEVGVNDHRGAHDEDAY